MAIQARGSCALPQHQLPSNRPYARILDYRQARFVDDFRLSTVTVGNFPTLHSLSSHPFVSVTKQSCSRRIHQCRNICNLEVRPSAWHLTVPSRYQTNYNATSTRASHEPRATCSCGYTLLYPTSTLHIQRSSGPHMKSGKCGRLVDYCRDEVRFCC